MEKGIYYRRDWKYNGGPVWNSYFADCLYLPSRELIISKELSKKNNMMGKVSSEGKEFFADIMHLKGALANNKIQGRYSNEYNNGVINRHSDVLLYDIRNIILDVPVEDLLKENNLDGLIAHALEKTRLKLQNS